MNKVAIIGATSGIGRALALGYAADGWQVGATGRRAELLEELRQAYPERIITRAYDVTQGQNAAELRQLIQALGGLDLCIYNSGAGHVNPELDWAQEEEAIRVNVLGFAQTVNAAYHYFAERKAGHFVTIASIAGLRGTHLGTAYGATKAYQIHYLQGLRKRVLRERSGIAITTILPGFVDTAMAKGVGLFWVAPADKAARQIRRAIARQAPRAYITRRWALIAQLMKHLPDFLYHRI
jgi:short-subunit dehydrogenase